MTKYTLTCEAASVASKHHSGYITLPEEALTTILDIVRAFTKLPDSQKHSIINYQITITKDE